MHDETQILPTQTSCYNVITDMDAMRKNANHNVDVSIHCVVLANDADSSTGEVAHSKHERSCTYLMVWK
jgi:hypothetical protein